MNNLQAVIVNKRQGLPSKMSRVFLCAKPSVHKADLRHVDHLLCLPKGYVGPSVCVQHIKRLLPCLYCGCFAGLTVLTPKARFSKEEMPTHFS